MLAGLRGPDPDAAAAAFLPNLSSFDIADVQWGPDGKSFTGKYRGQTQAARGNLIGENLSVDFTNVYISDGKGSYRVPQPTCSASLALTAQRDALEGALRCRDVPQRFRARFGL